MKPVRCAIYTRKSSEEGLEQGFNSLDAQREACAAYIRSQASEGWTALPDLYDDGGISGGTLERPALKRLLAVVEAGRVDVIVVYKVDRLSRSLFDFAKLVELLEKATCSFVSITQPISTTTSMGRLTLNMLLSFAQFEREVTAERIRDKIAASKAKGMFMGGVPPIGYTLDGRTLAVVPDHAALIVDIYRRYVRLGSVRLLEDELRRDHVVTPVRRLDSGRDVGGPPFVRGQLRRILVNRVYLGEIPHRDTVHAGLHPPIIDRSLWDEVQAKMASQGGERRAYRQTSSLLAGRIFDDSGEALIPVHSSRLEPGGEGRKRFSYYVSRSRHHGRSRAGIRIPAREIEALVSEYLAKALGDPLHLVTALGLDCPASAFSQASADASAVAAQVRERDPMQIRALVERIVVGPASVEIRCARAGLERALGLAASEGEPFLIMIKVRMKRSGNAMRMIEGGKQQLARIDPTLIRLILQARRYWAELRKGEINITQLAEREQANASYISRLVRLAFLSPQMLDAILAGRQRAGVASIHLLKTGAIDPLWSKQAKALA